MIRSRGWYDFNWSPVVGCLRGCEYCYLPQYMERFTGQKTIEPQFYPEKLSEPYEIKSPSTIFVCAFADLFGSWIPDEWIKAVIKTITETPRHTYVFLTKNPQRYREFEFPANVYLGITVEAPEYLHRAEALRDLPSRKLCSIEPVLGDFTGVDLSMFDWVVCGYMLGRKSTRQERAWMKSIVHMNKYQIIR